MATEGKQVFPADGRRRPRRKGNAALPDRYQQLVDGVLSIDDLDEEEILRGQLRNANGTFGGHHPKVIPWTMHQALKETMSKRTERRLIESLPEVLDALIRTAKHDRSGAARVAAAQVILDRALGKVVDKTESTVTVNARWEDAAKGGRIFVDLEPEAGDDVVEADVVDPPDTPHQIEIEARSVAETRPRTGITL